MRDASWAEDPEGLGAMMQVMVRSAVDPSDRGSAKSRPEVPSAASIRLLARLAQGGARGREETKSKMALMAHSLKRGYRHLGEVLAAARRAHDDRLAEVLERCYVLHAGRYVDDDSTPVTAGATIDVLPPFAGG